MQCHVKPVPPGTGFSKWETVAPLLRRSLVSLSFAQFLDAHGVIIVLFEHMDVQQLSQDSLMLLSDINSDDTEHIKRSAWRLLSVSDCGKVGIITDSITSVIIFTFIHGALGGWPSALKTSALGWWWWLKCEQICNEWNTETRGLCFILQVDG